MEFDAEQAENIKIAGRQKTSYPQEQVEIAGLYKPILNKTMTTHE